MVCPNSAEMAVSTRQHPSLTRCAPTTMLFLQSHIVGLLSKPTDLKKKMVVFLKSDSLEAMQERVRRWLSLPMDAEVRSLAGWEPHSPLSSFSTVFV